MGLVPTGRAMLRKSLIQVSVDGQGLCWPNYGGNNEDNETSFKRSYACTGALSAPDPAPGHGQATPPPQFGLRSNNREGTQPRPSTESWIKDLLSMAPPSEQDPVSPSVSVSHQEASISLYPSPTEGRQNENNHRKLTNLITWTTALSHSMKL